MVNYEVTVYNSERLAAYTRDYIYITLVGEKGPSKTTWLFGGKSFLGMELKVTITTEESLGKLQQVVVQKEKGRLFYFNDNWLPTKIEVKTETNETYIFPLYTWIADNEKHYFREGQAFIPSKDPFDSSSRQEELDNRQEAYRWKISRKRIPDHIKAKYCTDLPLDARFIFSKLTGFVTTGAMGKLWEEWKKPRFFYDNKWSGFDQIGGMMDYSKNKILDYVKNNWKDDDFFGYQFLNGLNPMVIRRCDTLPDNFPVTDDMISQHSNGPSWLDQEMQCGNIFLCDYKMLDKVEARKIDGKQQYLAAPLVLLHKTADDKLVPIAIQLKQEPGPDNPIFLPADQDDWLLAKTFVRSAEFNLHELNFHLLRTHLLAEVFAVSTRRNLPMVHPLYKSLDAAAFEKMDIVGAPNIAAVIQEYFESGHTYEVILDMLKTNHEISLLIPHTRYTLHINVLARTDLISKDGVLTTMSASGGEGMFKILEDSLSSMTYRSLCIPDDIADRGMENIPNFYYRDDGLKLWNSLHRFVAGILNLYYKTDEDVEEDPELQMWIWEIFRRGFLSNKNSGIPNKLTTVADLVKFVTMVIFTGSVQHSAVNSGQYEFGGWMPNLPSTMERPPPTEKGKASEATIMEALPDKTITLRGADTLYLLTREFADFVPFGNYPEEHFTEEEPRRLIQAFQNELKQLSDEIKKRNEKLDVPYEYLDPEKMGNSVSI